MKRYAGIIKIAALLILFPIIIWELSLKKTYTLYNENKQAEVLLKAVESRQSRPKEPSISVATPILSNGKLLEIMAQEIKEKQVEVVSYNPALINEDAEYKLYSGTMVLQGNFFNLVKIIDVIEKKQLPIKLSSVNFSYNPPKGKPTNKIELTLTFQQIES